jgi:hypothetical protein
MKHIHHIIPRHAGGTDDPENLIELTIEEHAEAHKKLFEKYGKIEDYRAWMGLAGLMSGKEIIYEILRQPKSQEHKNKISASLKNKPKPWLIGSNHGAGNKGKPKTEEHKRKISEAKTGVSRPDLVGNTFAKKLKGKEKSIEHKQAVKEALQKPEVKNKITASWKLKPIVQCPHCGIQGKEGHNMNRYHFDNCKSKNK